MSNSDKITETELLQDIKNFTMKKCIYRDNLDFILNFFADKNSEDMEKSSNADSVYKKLGWPGKNFDIINSFYTTFVCALVAFSDANKQCNEYFKDGKYYDWKWPIFKYGISTELSYATRYGLCDISKSSFANKAIDEKYLLYDILDDFRNSGQTEYIDLFNELASLCHCVANFMPCPPAYEEGKLSYNQLKGHLNEVSDYLPLFIDKIQFCYENHLPLTYQQNIVKNYIDFSTIQKWHKWFIDNRERYCLAEYYTIRGERIIGIPLFVGQSLFYPIPKTKEEISECLNNMIKCIKSRAKEIVYTTITADK